MKNNKKGFTIVELVIVIAVIAILAAVLIPTFSSVTNSAKESAAMQQAKSGLEAVLTLTNGTLTEGTIFAVTDDTKYAGTTSASDADAEYWFAFKGNKLEKVEMTSANGPIPTNTGAYTIYIPANYFPSENAVQLDAAHRNEVEGLIKSVLDKKTNGDDAVAITGVNNGVGAGTYGTTALSIYYTPDIKSTMVVFVAGEAATPTTHSVTYTDSNETHVSITIGTSDVENNGSTKLTFDFPSDKTIANYTIMFGDTEITELDPEGGTEGVKTMTGITKDIVITVVAK